MKNIWLGIISAMCAGSAMATVIFQDNFEKNSGALHNRRPDTFDSSVSALAWWKNEASNFTVTNGVLQTTTNGVASAWLTMPTVSVGQIIKVSAVLVANGDINTDYLSIGFSNLKNPTYSVGDPWLTMYRRIDTGNGKGILRVYSGLGSGGIRLVNQETLAEAQGFTTNLNARNTVNYEYNTTTGNLLVWLVSEGGTTVTQYNGSVQYGGTNGAAIPVDQIKYMALTFNSVNVLGSANPAYLDNLTVEVISEVATNFPLIVNGGTGSGSYTNGQQVAIAASNAPSGKTFDVWTGGTQYLASAASFASNTVIMPTNDVTLTATYKDLVYTLTGSVTGGNGTVTPSSTNVVYGSNADFVVTANPYYRIATLTTNGASVTGMTFDNGSSAANFTWTNVQADGALAATFTNQVANDPAGTPYSWLASYGLTNGGATFDQAAEADQDLDGLKAWQEYIAGTDPTNTGSCLKAAQATRNTVTWSPVAGRVYSVCWSTNLVQGFTNLATGIPSSQSSFTNLNPSSKVNHYQVKVQME